ncbi:MAG: hypothetical protein D6695_07840 [Planctomycetota bacterium]|nr:MAG: hypothetical protein D6695_07840 [Planctomycetota bacterium]
MKNAITIFDPGAAEPARYAFEIEWMAFGVAATVVFATAVTVHLFLRARLRSSAGELAARALARRMGLSRRSRRALWRVADALGMREQAGVLLLSRSALLSAVGKLATGQVDPQVAGEASTLVEAVCGKPGG